MRKYVVRGVLGAIGLVVGVVGVLSLREATLSTHQAIDPDSQVEVVFDAEARHRDCLLYTSPSPRDRTRSRMPSSA